LDRTSFRVQYGIEPDRVIPQDTLVCFRCGVCCTEYQPQLTMPEAQYIAAAMGIDLETFIDRYTDDSWPGFGSYLIDTYQGACIFLERSEGSKVASCRIHQIRPQACREWLPALSRKECQQGLKMYWGLTVGTSGQLQGPAEKIRRFQEFLKSIKAE